MEEVILLFIFVLIYLYSFVYRNMAIIAVIVVGLTSLYNGVNPIFIWAIVFALTIIRFSKHGIKDEF